MAKNMAKRYVQGDMKSVTRKDIQKPDSNFSQRGFSKTLEYNERHDAFEGKRS